MENEMRKHIDSFKNFINENIDIKDFNISGENILKSFGDSKYVVKKQTIVIKLLNENSKIIMCIFSLR